ncbi:MAG: alpha/beta fold hydrolase [Dehalococcoidales bacterium]
MDLSLFDRREVLEALFPLVYSPNYASDPEPLSPAGVPIYHVEVEEGVTIDCGFWVNSRESPSILYFHGNGETVAGYSFIAPFYTERGINLCVVDYRGYGSSGGKPTVTNMLADAHIVLNRFKTKTARDGYNDKLFVMGRSLGSLPALELAFHHQDEISGLIIESGTANNFSQMWSNLGLNQKEPALDEQSLFLNKVKIRQVRIPTLIIHGENDELIPVREGQELYKNSAAPQKKILIIPGAGHNDIMTVKQDLYFDTIGEFIQNNIR